MSLLNYTTHTSVAGAKDLLSKLRTFLTGQGWSEEDYQTSVAWTSDGDGTYSWQAGDQDFLDVESTGYGSQVLRWRLLVDPYDASDHTLYYCPIDPTDPDVDETSAQSPQLQNNWQGLSYHRTSLPAGTFTQVWFFGTARYVLVVCQVSSTEVTSFAFGLPDLETGMQDEDVQFHWPAQYMPSETATYSWQNITAQNSNWWNCCGWIGVAAQGGDAVWWQGADRNENHYRVNMGIQRTSIAGSFTRLNDAIALNGFTHSRTLIKPTVFLKDASTSVWYPVATMPMYYTIFTGLAIGEQIDYSGESFLVFPTLLSSYTYGMAVRIV